jgi:hypothetical protein
MKLTSGILALVAIATGTAAVAQTPAVQNWEGIWHANVGGQPASTLTLATDTGRLGGTFVLDMIGDKDGQPHVIASEPHVLLNPLVAGDTLTFDVKMRRPDGVNAQISFEVKRTGTDKATIRCVNCGAGAPVVEVVKELN